MRTKRILEPAFSLQLLGPRPLEQLSEACTMVRQHHETAYVSLAADDSALIRTLHLLDIGTTVRAILRQFYLLRLLERRIEQEDFHKGTTVSTDQSPADQEHSRMASTAHATGTYCSRGFPQGSLHWSCNATATSGQPPICAYLLPVTPSTAPRHGNHKSEGSIVRMGDKCAIRRDLSR